MYTLPKLSFPYETLQPVIDTETMKVHHSKHHQTYVDKLNEALAGESELQARTVEELLVDLDDLPEEVKSAVRNHGGGHANHTFFWQILQSPREDNKPEGQIEEAINKTFGDMDSFKKEFTASALSVFGSGWVWLVADSNKDLKIITTPNQDSPLTLGLTPILGLDVWEHAYYLQYQNRRAEYVSNFFSIVNWSKVSEFYLEN